MLAAVQAAQEQIISLMPQVDLAVAATAAMEIIMLQVA